MNETVLILLLVTLMGGLGCVIGLIFGMARKGIS